MRDVVEWCRELGIKDLTFWAFSTENKSRDKEEVDALFKFFEKNLVNILNELNKKKDEIKVRFVGRLDMFPEKTVEKVREVEKRTANNKEFNLTFLMGYGGRQEIVDATNRIIEDVKKGKLKEVDENVFSSYLYAPELPNPDLIIRTSGEQRLSGLFPWQSVYSELFFCDKLWPDITKEDIAAALNTYKERQRRFGK
jgi:undecaprenyl diphosphate synthase